MCQEHRIQHKRIGKSPFDHLLSNLNQHIVTRVRTDFIIFQFFSPGASLTPNSVTAKKSSFNRPKSAEPGSPLLRRALSPDRLHPPRCSNVDGKKNTTISPLCSPSCKVVVSTTPKLTISTQMSPQGVSHVGHKSGEVSPLPSRALHTSPLASSVVDNRDSGDQQGNVLLRKHSKQSLR